MHSVTNLVNALRTSEAAESIIVMLFLDPVVNIIMTSYLMVILQIFL